MRSSTAAALVVLVASSALLPIPDARACGGCFHPQTESQSTVVVGHRMAFAVSTAQAVLWDQIKYAGSPTDFAWVLPVKGGAVLQLSNDAWFETLDAATSAQVLSPPFTCIPASAPGCSGGCGSASASLANFGGDGQTSPPPVTVTHEGTVGPYETVTLHANVPNALPAWLTSHGYAIDASVKPIIDAYTAEGFDFIALRLLPGQGVQQMAPVRVVTSGMSASLPLRMVAAGTGTNVAITLFVIGEGRYEAQNFPNAQIDPATITWDFGSQSSSYATTRAALLATNGGRTWNNAFAQQGSLLTQDTSGGAPLSITVGSSTYPTFAQAYVQQGLLDGTATGTECLNPLEYFANSTEQVAGGCLAQGAGVGTGGTGGAGTGGAGTGGAGTGGGSPCTVPSGEIDASQLACGPLDDLAVALVGLHPRDVWLTRLEANLPRTALATDLVLQASATQTPISSVIQTTTATGDPCTPVGGAVAFGRDGALRNRFAVLTAVLAALLAALLRRRVRPGRGPWFGEGALPTGALARPRTMKAGSIATLALVLLCGAARDAAADEYQDHVDRAAILTEHDRYREALAELEAASALRQSPLFLFEMARAHERLGEARAALAAYEQFLAGAGADPAQRAEATVAVARLRSRARSGAQPPPSKHDEPPAPVQYERKPRTGLTAGGAVLFGLGYAGAVVTGSLFLSSGGNGCASYTIGNQAPVYNCPNGNVQIASGLLLIPGAGPFLAALAYRETAWSVDWALIDGAAQAGGLLMMIYAAKHPRDVPVCSEALQLAPYGGPHAGGLQAMGRF